MTTRERQHQHDDTTAIGAPTPDAELRRTAERLYDEAGEAIRRALSQDSAAFVSAARQASAE